MTRLEMMAAFYLDTECSQPNMGGWQARWMGYPEPSRKRRIERMRVVVERLLEMENERLRPGFHSPVIEYLRGLLEER